jgi:HAE1 family hydrophobic/amphiphilic exporter-1
LLETTAPVAIRERLVAFSHSFAGADLRVHGSGPAFANGPGASTYMIRVLGYDYRKVREIAEDLGRRLERFPRVRDVNTHAAERSFNADRVTELVLRLHHPRLALLGLTERTVAERLAAALDGQSHRGVVLRFDGGERRLAVKMPGYATLDIERLRNLPLPTGTGATVRLADIADVQEREVAGRIVREDQQYQRVVSYEYRGASDLGSRTYDAVVASTALPNGYTLVVSDGSRWSDDERRQMYAVLAVSLVLIFIVAATLFESVRQPLCVLLTVPMALIGVFLTFAFTGASFTREAYIGVIMMAGLVVNHAILLIHQINVLRRDTGLALRAAIVQGTVQRARPILMTGVSTVCALLALVLYCESPDATIWNALAYAVIGGISTSTVLVLLVTPALYLLLERHTAN